MRFTRRPIGIALLTVLVVAGAGAEADAQVRRLRAQAQGGAAQPAEAGPDAAELTRLFDAYAVMQAQETLGLDEAKFGPFVTRLRSLQDVRRKRARERNVALRELRRLVNGSGTETQIRERLDELTRIDATAQADETKARATIDELLDVRQQAKFRLLEQQLELRRLELVGRARQRLRNAPR